MAKCITVKQPWASLIVHGIKDIENRTWKTNFRGRVLIHAGRLSKNGEYGSTVFYANGSKVPAKDFKMFSVLNDQQQKSTLESNFASSLYGEIPTGAIIGSVEIVDCVINHLSIWAEKTIDGNKPIYNWVLANPILFDKLIPAKGKLSFWDFEIPETFQK